MKLYLEAKEQANIEQSPEFIRIDVTGMTQAEQDGIQADIEAVMAGKSYQLTRHTCHHEDGLNQPCVQELIKEV